MRHISARLAGGPIPTAFAKSFLSHKLRPRDILLNVPQSCFDTTQLQEKLYIDMAARTQLSAPDAAFLIDALRHVVNPVVVCVRCPSTALLIRKPDMDIDQRWRNCFEERRQSEHDCKALLRN